MFSTFARHSAPTIPMTRQWGYRSIANNLAILHILAVFISFSCASVLLYMNLLDHLNQSALNGLRGDMASIRTMLQASNGLELLKGEIKGLQVSYAPSRLTEKGGDAFFQVWQLKADGSPEEKPEATGKAAVGAKFDAGQYDISVKEVRYWAAMNVRHEPGKPIILTCLWVALSGMIITTYGRIRKSNSQSKSSVAINKLTEPREMP